MNKYNILILNLLIIKITSIPYCIINSKYGQKQFVKKEIFLSQMIRVGVQGQKMYNR